MSTEVEPFWQTLLTHPEFKGLSDRDILERLGASLRARGPPITPVIYTIGEFCTAHRISRSQLYKLWREGAGPRVKRVGTKVLITAEAAAEWRAAGEVGATSEVTEATR
jgi:hypothetical protein